MQGDHLTQVRQGRWLWQQRLPCAALWRSPYGFLYNQYGTPDIGRRLGFFR